MPFLGGIMRARHAAVAAIIPALSLPITLASVEAAPAVRIAYVQYDSPGKDTGSSKSLNAEWVRIKNTSGSKKSLTGWTLRDPAGHVYRFGKFTLRGGRAVTIHTGSGSNSAAHRYWGQGWYVWNNTGDKATLRNKAGSTVDTCKWGDGDGSIAC